MEAKPQRQTPTSSVSDHFHGSVCFGGKEIIRMLSLKGQLQGNFPFPVLESRQFSQKTLRKKQKQKQTTKMNGTQMFYFKYTHTAAIYKRTQNWSPKMGQSIMIETALTPTWPLHLHDTKLTSVPPMCHLIIHFSCLFMLMGLVSGGLVAF